MAEWSMMPHELLDEISDHLDARSDVVRFRSVCSTWRSAVPPGRRLLPPRFPILPNEGIADFTLGFCLSKRSVYLLSVPHYPPGQVDPHRRGSSWLIKVKEDVPNRMALLNPLSRVESGPFPNNFPRVLDTSKIRVSELASEFVMQYMTYPHLARDPVSNGLNIYMEKVVFMGLNCTEFVVLTIHVSGKLAVYKSGDKRWSIIGDMPSPYDDVILFKDKFFAVDGTGRTVNVGLDLKLTEVAGPTFGGDKKFLVESLGELLLADMYLTVYADYEGPVDVEPDEFNSIVTERTVKFKVYKLDLKEKKWVEVRELGDRVLFLGEDCTFSASSSDLKACKGNCIFFTGEFYYSNGDDDGIFQGHDIGVFDMGTGRIGPLDDYIGYSELFWPPPEWITSRTAEVRILFPE
ncbi:hypothetical protein CDL15_Pgr019737 [Punica granatum]|uniref:F-box domain-containing protein n=1 Tax=Punica granatum TaxID=22663 RepID=A0A218X677_PUNGR|nr:hypothetical protein CDL15_Pgr019737 [Punica granatum]